MAVDSTMVHVSDETWQTIQTHAVADYPDECCGVVTEDASAVVRAHPCENIQDRLHEADPKTHPRTARTAYRMDDLQVTRILDDTEKAGGRMIAIYHSHVDCDAYFSEEDQLAATFFGEPAYPNVSYLVVSVVDGEMKAKRAFVWDPDGSCFVEAVLAKLY
jgi:proteasome lid subunit RPN8/RPN11